MEPLLQEQPVPQEEVNEPQGAISADQIEGEIRNGMKRPTSSL